MIDKTRILIQIQIHKILLYVITHTSHTKMNFLNILYNVWYLSWLHYLLVLLLGMIISLCFTKKERLDNYNKHEVQNRKRKQQED